MPDVPSSAPSPTPAARPVELLGPPHRVAATLRHLPGFVFLDSASRARGGISLLAAHPSRLHRGTLHDAAALAALESTLARRAPEPQTSPDLALPLGGLIGHVAYDGTFVFGEYEHLLIYHHATCAWTQVGDPIAAFALPPGGSPHPSQTYHFTPDLPRAHFENIVRDAKAFIASGDIYQVNLTQRFTAPLPENCDPFPFYLQLREASPAPYAAFLDFTAFGETTQVLSASPESFLRISGRTIESRPIKGTRPRFPDPDADERSAYDLITSPKEIAELVMITDLLRNDLGQVCAFGSVHVPELLKLKKFSHVHHLVSTVAGTLRESVSHAAALAACSPGGSITGAPKRRAREIIALLEPVPRGLYTGAVGYLGFNGESQFSIAIRTVIADQKNNRLHFHTGAGIVADSDPAAEYEETLHKAAGIFRAASPR